MLPTIVQTAQYTSLFYEKTCCKEHFKEGCGSFLASYPTLFGVLYNYHLVFLYVLLYQLSNAILILEPKETLSPFTETTILVRVYGPELNFPMPSSAPPCKYISKDKIDPAISLGAPLVVVSPLSIKN